MQHLKTTLVFALLSALGAYGQFSFRFGGNRGVSAGIGGRNVNLGGGLSSGISLGANGLDVDYKANAGINTNRVNVGSSNAGSSTSSKLGPIERAGRKLDQLSDKAIIKAATFLMDPRPVEVKLAAAVASVRLSLPNLRQRAVNAIKKRIPNIRRAALKGAIKVNNGLIRALQ